MMEREGGWGDGPAAASFCTRRRFGCKFGSGRFPPASASVGIHQLLRPPASAAAVSFLRRPFVGSRRLSAACDGFRRRQLLPSQCRRAFDRGRAGKGTASSRRKGAPDLLHIS